MGPPEEVPISCVFHAYLSTAGPQTTPVHLGAPTGDLAHPMATLQTPPPIGTNYLALHGTPVPLLGLHGQFHHIFLVATHVPGLQSTRADCLSCRATPHHDWAITWTYLFLVFQKWGHPDLNVFASRNNRKCEQFCSRGSFVSGRWSPHSLDRQRCLYVPSDTSGDTQTNLGEARGNSDHPVVVFSEMVSCATAPPQEHVSPFPTGSRLPLSPRGHATPSRCPTSEVNHFETSLRRWKLCYSTAGNPRLDGLMTTRGDVSSTSSTPPTILLQG